MTRTRALALLAVLLAGCALTSKGTPEEVTWYTPEPNPAANAKASAHSPANLKLALPTPCSLDRVTGRSQRRLGSGHAGRGI